jgi:drug/metabolite transporter (DMT)-like permease
MPRFDLHKTFSTTGEVLKQLSLFNPLTIRKKGTRVKAIFSLALVCFFWGTSWIASRQGVRYMPALQMAGIRQTVAGLCFVIFFLSRGHSLPRGKEWITVIILSLLNFTLSNGLSTWGLKFVSAGLGSIMGSMFPLWLVVIGLIFSGTRIPARAIAGLLLGFAGICIIFYDHLDDFLRPEFRFGLLISFIATFTWALGTLYTKKKAISYNPYFSLGLQMLLSGFFLTLFTQLTSTATVQAAVPFLSIPWQSWLAIAYLVTFGSVISFVAYLFALQNLPTTQVSLYAYVNPVVAVLLGWMLFNEDMTIFIVVGGGIVLCGVFLVNEAFRGLPVPEQPEAEGI